MISGLCRHAVPFHNIITRFPLARKGGQGIAVKLRVFPANLLDTWVNLGKRSILVEDVASKLSVRLTEFFKSEEIESLGRESGFIQRRGTLTADSFVKVLMFQDFDGHSRSLTDIVSCLYLEHSQAITKQALGQRFTSRSVLFLKTLLEKFLKEMLPNESKLEQFLLFN